MIWQLFNDLEPFSVTNNSVGSRTAAADIVGAAVVVHVAHSGRSWVDAVICNWKRLKIILTQTEFWE